MEQESETTRTTEQDELSNALSTIAQAVLGQQLESIGRSVTDLGSDLSARIEKEIDRVAADLETRVDELVRKLEATVERYDKTISDLDRRMEAAIGEIRDELGEAREQAESDVAEARSDATDRIAAREQELRNELQTIAGGLSEVQLGLHQQLEASERFSSLLGNVASAFSGLNPASLEWVGGQEPDPQETQVVAIDGAAATAPSAADVESEIASSEVEGTLDKLFAE